MIRCKLFFFYCVLEMTYRSLTAVRPLAQAFQVTCSQAYSITLHLAHVMVYCGILCDGNLSKILSNVAQITLCKLLYLWTLWKSHITIRLLNSSFNNNDLVNRRKAIYCCGGHIDRQFIRYAVTHKREFTY